MFEKKIKQTYNEKPVCVMQLESCVVYILSVLCLPHFYIRLRCYLGTKFLHCIQLNVSCERPIRRGGRDECNRPWDRYNILKTK